MANTFKVSTRDVAPATAGSFEEIYDCPDSRTAVIIGLSLANVHTAQVTASVQLVSTTNQDGSTQNTTAHLIKDAPIPVGSTLEVMQGNKIILNARENAVIFYSKLGYVNLGKIDVGIDIKHFQMKKNLKNYPSRSE